MARPRARQTRLWGKVEEAHAVQDVVRFEERERRRRMVWEIHRARRR